MKRVRALGVLGATAAIVMSIALWPKASEGQQRRRVLRSVLKQAFTPQPVWSLEDAVAKLQRNPRDPYLQYVVLMLAQRENKVSDVLSQMRWQINRQPGSRRRENVDLFNIFSGSLAVQESLQLDSMVPSQNQFGSQFDGNRRTNQPAVGDAAKTNDKPATDADKPTLMFEIKGPEVKSHPWKEMLAGKSPAVSELSKMVPVNFYLIEFRSLTKLLDLMNEADIWNSHFLAQSFQTARSDLSGDRIRAELAIETNKLLQPFYDSVVQDVAATGSDLYFREGSDVTLLFRVKQPELFQSRMDGFLAHALKSNSDAKENVLNIRGVDVRHIATPDRRINVFSAYPYPNVHIRSNSQIAIERVLESCVGVTSDGKRIKRLGETDEFAFIRTLMPYGAKEEDGFIYLSDPFIRNIVGPQIKLTERRRIICYNHLRMIGHASLLHQSEQGKAPTSLADLVASKSARGLFGEGDLTCPDGGKYSLAADGVTGVCSHHGSSQHLKPCCELEIGSATKEEVDQYQAFVTAYSQYWRTFFDPIAIRVQVTPKKYRAETIVLPLIDNSIYTGLASALGGKVRSLDFVPVPKRNIFTMSMQFDKAKLLKNAPIPDIGAITPGVRRNEKVHGITDSDVEKFVKQGLGERLSLNVYDAMPYFDFSLSQTLGQMTGSMSGRSGFGRFDESLSIGFLLASLNAPVYLVVEVLDEKVVDDFLDKTERWLSEFGRRIDGGFFSVEYDSYSLSIDQQQRMRCHSIAFGPIKWRIFWGRVGKGLCFATKPFIMEDLTALQTAKANGKGDVAESAAEPAAHAMLRVRAKNWNYLIPEYRLGWAENQRIACLDNLSTMESILRSIPVQKQESKSDVENARIRMVELDRMLQRIYSQKFACPECGVYQTKDGRRIGCTVHGTLDLPRQPSGPVANSPAANFFGQLKDLMVYLTFLEDGLHATVEIERK